jgi:hypothetical protein
VDLLEGACVLHYFPVTGEGIEMREARPNLPRSRFIWTLGIGHGKGPLT